MSVIDLKQKTRLTDFKFKNPVREKKYKMGKEIIAKQSKRLTVGEHKGEITKIVFVDTPYEYTQIFIKEDKTQAEIKTDCPTSITKDTALGKLLMNMGVAVEVDKGYDVEALLIGKKVSFVSRDNETDNGIFSEILVDSVKLEK